MAASATYSPVKVFLIIINVVIVIVIVIVIIIFIVVIICSLNHFCSDRLKIEGSNVINMDIPATNGVIQANDASDNNDDDMMMAKRSYHDDQYWKQRQMRIFLRADNVYFFLQVVESIIEVPGS